MIRMYMLGAAIACAQVPAALAADQQRNIPAPAERPQWTLQLTPYLWAASIKGKVSPFQRAPTVSIHKPFSDIVDDLNLGFFANLWGRYENFVFSADLMYVDTTDTQTFGPLPPLPVPIPAGITAKTHVDTTQLTLSMLGGYRVQDTRTFTLDVLAGIRYWQVSNDLTVKALGTSYHYGERFDWVDPVIGTRVFYRLTKELSLQTQADIGGFGLGSGSDLTWSVLASVNYAFNDSASASLGYKILDVDYDHGAYVHDVRLKGPAIGATWRF